MGNDKMLADMLGVSLNEVRPPTLWERIVPQCDCCGKRVLSCHRAYCTECNSVVCGSDEQCHKGHSYKCARASAKKYFDKRAQGYGWLGRISKPGVSPVISQQEFEAKGLVLRSDPAAAETVPCSI